MVALTSHQTAIKEVFCELSTLINRQHRGSQGSVDCECVFGDERGHYLLVKLGWVGGRRVRATTLHVRFRDGKIWIEEDMTEDGIAAAIMKRGVPKDEIVLAFQSPEMRRHTEFAVA